MLNVKGNLSVYLISKKSLVKSIAMSPYYFLPIVVAVLNPPSLRGTSLPSPDTLQGDSLSQT